MTTRTTLYVYDTETTEPHPLIAIIEGIDNADCEAVADERWGSDRYGTTYSPAFGVVGGLRFRRAAPVVKTSAYRAALRDA